MSTCPDSAETSFFIEKTSLMEKKEKRKNELLMIEMFLAMRSGF